MVKGKKIAISAFDTVYAIQCFIDGKRVKSEDINKEDAAIFRTAALHLAEYLEGHDNRPEPTPLPSNAGDYEMTPLQKVACAIKEREERELRELLEEQKKKGMICDGCLAESPFEHLCHNVFNNPRQEITVGKKRVPGPCICTACLVSSQVNKQKEKP